MSYEHFARKEEEISNKYMSANGENETPKMQEHMYRSKLSHPLFFLAIKLSLCGVAVYYILKKIKK